MHVDPKLRSSLGVSEVELMNEAQQKSRRSRVGLRVWGLGFRVCIVAFWIYRLAQQKPRRSRVGFRVWGLGFSVCIVVFWIYRLAQRKSRRSRVWHLGF